MEKIKITKKELRRLGEFYQLQLSNFIYQVASPAMIYRINDHLETIRRQKLEESRYLNKVWKIRFFVKPAGVASFELDADDNTFEIVE